MNQVHITKNMSHSNLVGFILISSSHELLKKVPGRIEGDKCFVHPKHLIDIKNAFPGVKWETVHLEEQMKPDVSKKGNKTSLSSKEKSVIMTDGETDFKKISWNVFKKLADTGTFSDTLIMAYKDNEDYSPFLVLGGGKVPPVIKKISSMKIKKIIHKNNG